MRPPTPPCELHVERFVQAFAVHWGLDVDSLRKSLFSQMKRMMRARGLEPGAPLEALVAALASPGDVAQDPRAVVEAVLTPLAVQFRNEALRPILKELYDWIRAQLTYRLGALCYAYRDDAVGRTLEVLISRYWRASWSTCAGQDHLRRYALKAAARTAIRMALDDQAREVRPVLESEPVLDPESVALRMAEEKQREALASMVRDANCLIDLGLTPAEANAIARSTRPSSMAGLDARAAAAHIKAAQRGKTRLRRLVPRLMEGDHLLRARSPARCTCLVEHLGLRGRFRVVDCSAGGLGLETPQDEAALEIGANCTVRIHSDSTVIVQGARCVRIDHADGKVMIDLQFLFPNPQPPLPLWHQGSIQFGGH
jgi:PilZ domain-containing protein